MKKIFTLCIFLICMSCNRLFADEIYLTPILTSDTFIGGITTKLGSETRELTDRNKKVDAQYILHNSGQLEVKTCLRMWTRNHILIVDLEIANNSDEAYALNELPISLIDSNRIMQPLVDPQVLAQHFYQIGSMDSTAASSMANVHMQTMQPQQPSMYTYSANVNMSNYGTHSSGTVSGTVTPVYGGGGFWGGFAKSFDRGMGAAGARQAMAREAIKAGNFVLTNALRLGEIPPHVKKRGLIYYPLTENFPIKINIMINDKTFNFTFDNVKKLGLDFEQAPEGLKIVKKHKKSLVYGTYLKKGDIITKIGELKPEERLIMPYISAKFQTNEKIPFEVSRKLDKKEVVYESKVILVKKKPLYDFD